MRACTRVHARAHRFSYGGARTLRCNCTFWISLRFFGVNNDASQLFFVLSRYRFSGRTSTVLTRRRDPHSSRWILVSLHSFSSFINGLVELEELSSGPDLFPVAVAVNSLRIILLQAAGCTCEVVCRSTLPDVGVQPSNTVRYRL